MADEPIVTVRDIYTAMTNLTSQMADLHSDVNVLNGQFRTLCRRMDEQASRDKEWRASLEDKVKEVKRHQRDITDEHKKLWAAIQNIKVKVYGFTAALSFLGLLVGILTTFDSPS